MRPRLLAAAALFLVGCDQIPALRNLMHKGSRIKRQSEKEDVNCEAKAGRPPRDGCVSGALECGRALEGNTTGGRQHFDDDFYVTKYCQPQQHNYSGNERVYTLDLAANTGANIWLDSDCADLDLFTIRWTYDGKCPTPSHTVSECEVDAASGGGVVHVENVGNAAQYMVIVDGKQGVEAPFRLTVECGASR